MNSRGTYTGKRTVTGWVVALTAIGSLMAALDTLVVSTSLSTIRLDLGASIEDLEWTVNAYNLSFAVLLIPAAALGDPAAGFASALRDALWFEVGIYLLSAAAMMLLPGEDAAAQRGASRAPTAEPLVEGAA